MCRRLFESFPNAAVAEEPRHFRFDEESTARRRGQASVTTAISTGMQLGPVGSPSIASEYAILVKPQQVKQGYRDSLGFYEGLALGVLDPSLDPRFPSLLVCELSLDHDVLSCERRFLVFEVEGCGHADVCREVQEGLHSSVSTISSWISGVHPGGS